MKSHIIVQFRISTAQGRQLKAAAKRRGLKLATWVREAAILTAEHNPDLQRWEFKASAPLKFSVQ